MTKRLSRTFFCLSMIMLCSLMTYAQLPADAQRITNKNHSTAILSFQQTPQQIADHQQLLKDITFSSDKIDFELEEKDTDALGFTHYRYQQIVDGFPVLYNEYGVHEKNGAVDYVEGKAINPEQVDLTSRLNVEEAIDKAILLAKKECAESTQVRASMTSTPMVIFPVSEFKGQLCYQITVEFAGERPSMIYYISAANGDLIKTVDRNCNIVATNCKADTRYSGMQYLHCTKDGSKYYLKDYNRNVYTHNLKNGKDKRYASDFYSTSSSFTASKWNNSKKDNAALDAHWAGGVVAEYWEETWDRNSFDGRGSDLNIYVHYGVNEAQGFWDNDALYLGDGDATTDALTSLDIVAHEYGHAVCDYTAKLKYQGESGALNEALSDIWAACIVDNMNMGKNIWMIGDEVDKRSGHRGFRSMSNPKVEKQPDTYDGRYWKSPWGSDDNGGVHTNSGVFNHWFYILSEGKRGTNDNGYSYNVEGISIEDAQNIVWRMERYYMKPDYTFIHAYIHGVKAAEDLYGAGSEVVDQVKKAFYAVGVGNEYESSTKSAALSGNLLRTNNIYESIASVKINDEQYVLNPMCYGLQNSSVFTFVPGEILNLDFEARFTQKPEAVNWGAWLVIEEDGEENLIQLLSGKSNEAGQLMANVQMPIMKSGQFGTIRIVMDPDQLPEYDDKSEFSQSVDFRFAVVDSSKSLSKQVINETRFYPNPVKDKLLVEVKEVDELSNVQIVDFKGCTFLSSKLKFGKNEVNLDNIPQGVYLLKINTPGQDRAEKLIVQ